MMNLVQAEDARGAQRRQDNTRRATERRVAEVSVEKEQRVEARRADQRRVKPDPRVVK